MKKLYYDKIVCPYCHGAFSHRDVHFRMETYFEEEEDLNDEGKFLTGIKRMPEGPERARLLEQVERNRLFLCGPDEKYEQFWENFGGTVEEDTGIGRMYGVHSWYLPVLDPSNPEHQKVLKLQRASGTDMPENYGICDRDGMVTAVEDIYGRKTFRRVCPYCHNPLPTGYGKHETKFISVIGNTQSGKTAYISQLLKYICKYASYADMSAYFTEERTPGYVENNPVREGVPMPRASKVGSLTGPLCFDLVRDVGGKQLECSTIVLYDIAGECCTDVRVMKHFGSFVAKSDGVIALLEPGQLGLGDSSDGAQAEWMRNPCGIFNVVYDMLAERDNGGKVNVPVAVCISKSDMISGILPTECRGDITPVVHPSSGDPIRKFNATAYNPLEKLLADQMRHGAGQEVHGALRRGYKHFNYFAFSATGCAVEKMDGLSYPKAPPVPLRIAEPLLWLFYKFGYIGSDVPIRLPVQREMPESVPETVKGPLPFMKKTVQRPLTDEEKERYWYESRT